MSVFNENYLLRYCFIFSIISIGFYWLIGEPHDRYLYPFLPFFCIVLATVFVKLTPFKIRTVACVVLILGIFRILYNFLIMPIQQTSHDDRVHAQEIIKLSNGQQIFLTGWEVVRHFEKEYFGMEFIDTEIKYPAPIPYVIPYIITKETGKIVQFETELESGNLYLSPAPFMNNKNVEILYTVPVDYIEGGLLLCRFL